ncbi:MAG: TolC family protein [Candidatus Omnitrophica bacterium]|nr:TolC family protein [Candidatus Omnitrophota bacterium]
MPKFRSGALFLYGGKMQILKFLFLIGVFSIHFGVIARDVENKEKIKLTTKEAVQRALQNNPEIKSNIFELGKADTNFLKAESKYSWRLIAGVDSKKSILPDNQLNFFSGTKISDDKIFAGIEKIFTTGTYFKVEVSNNRFDSNAFEDPIRNAGTFRALALPPLYTGAITVTLSQDLLKNTFGVQDRNLKKILENQSEISKLDLSFKVSNSIVNTLVSYWTYVISDSSIKTYEKLLQNVKNVRNLTIQKSKLGLSENFEINQWNALLAQTENQLEKTKLEREENKNKLLRILGLPNTTEIGEISDLKEEIPSDYNVERDTEYAFQNRADWKTMIIRKEIVALTEKSAKDNALPSIKLTVIGSSKGQTIVAPQNNFLDTNEGTLSRKYYEATANLRVTYPIADSGIKADLRDAKISEMQVSLLEQDLKREIEDDIRIKYETVVATHKILQNSIQMRKQSEAYYNGLYRSFNQGRFNSITVKNALDTLVQNQLQETQAKINFNIEILRYEIARNSLLKTYEIDVEQLIPKL